MPEKEFRLSCSGKIDIAELARLKLYWRVSMQAALVRAKQVGLLSDNQSTYLWRQMSKLGYRTNEPASTQFKVDEPTVLKKVVAAHIDGLGYSASELAKAMSLNVGDLFSFFPVPPEGGRKVPRLRVVPNSRAGS
jgi:Zn-dependent peptidase ImmA (M78 family)